MMKFYCSILALLFFNPLFSQVQISMAMAEPSKELPYREIPAYPENFTAENVAARMIDGLGFRFYWATEGLRPIDLAYRPTDAARSSEETIDHILGLSTIILNATQNQVNMSSGEEKSPLTFEEKRKMILDNLQTASEKLKQAGANLENLKVVFQNGEDTREAPFWNLINGPIADALWHTGQVVTFRRSSDNPFNSKVSLFYGKLRE